MGVYRQFTADIKMADRHKQQKDTTEDKPANRTDNRKAGVTTYNKEIEGIPKEANKNSTHIAIKGDIVIIKLYFH